MYYTKKNEITTNILGVCMSKMQFIDVIPSWKGLGEDDKVDLSIEFVLDKKKDFGLRFRFAYLGLKILIQA